MDGFLRCSFRRRRPLGPVVLSNVTAGGDTVSTIGGLVFRGTFFTLSLKSSGLLCDKSDGITGSLLSMLVFGPLFNGTVLGLSWRAVSGAMVDEVSGDGGETNCGAGDIFSWEMSSSSGIRLGPGVVLGSTLRGWGVWGSVTLRGGAGHVSGAIGRLGCGTNPVMSSESIFNVVT